uniref:Uncharacterized protein n=1 Tax=Magallana gigas TaxID=29159 RepID=A0A8W8K3J7_MAGGI
VTTEWARARGGPCYIRGRTYGGTINIQTKNLCFSSPPELTLCETSCRMPSSPSDRTDVNNLLIIVYL